jgi:hypothetical protein
MFELSWLISSYIMLAEHYSFYQSNRLKAAKVIRLYGPDEGLD